MKNKLLPVSAFCTLKRFLLLSLFISYLLPANAQDFQWAQSFQRGEFVDFSNSAASDAAGNSYYGGAFDNNLQIGSYSLSSPGTNLYVAKFDASGNVLWAEPFINNAFFSGAIYDLEVDAAGNCIVTGAFEDQLIVNGDTLDATQSLGPDFFVAKLDPAGNVLWVKQGSGDSNDEVMNLDLDAAGNIYMSGYSFSFATDYDGQTIPAGAGESFIIKAGPNGQHLWSKRLEVDDMELAVKANGDGYLTGSFATSTLNLGNGITLPHYGSPAYSTGFAASFNAAGQFQWAQMIGGPYVNPVRIRTDQAGDAVIAGVYQDSLRYGTTTLTGAPGSEDFFLMKINSAGNLQWVRGIENLGTNLNFVGFASGPQLELDGDGNAVISNVHEGPVKLTGSVTHTPSTNTSDILVAKYSGSGNFLWFLPVGGPGFEVLTGMGVSPNGSVTLSGEVADSAGNPVNTQFGSISLTTNGEGAFVARIINDGNRIAGSVFVDQNGSGTQDAGEPGAPYVRVQLQTGQSTFTDANGNFSTFTDSGTYQITLPQVPVYYTNSTGSHTANFTGINQADTTNHFALQPQSSVQDLRVDVAQLNPARPGFLHRTRITYRNMGTTVMSGTLRVVADSLLTPQFTTPAPTMTSGDTLLWSFTGLQPMEMRNVLVEWQVPVDSTLALGDSVMVRALVDPVTGDQNISDNALTVSAVIQGSFDPNDKLVSHRIMTPAQVAAGRYLTYTVRFQNTGTDTAFFAVVRDELSLLLDMNTLEVISSSHPFTMRLTGPTSVEWDFGTILLPDSNTNEPLSHGYIQYRIKPLPTLTLGQHINTHANIYFDFNPPVMTNITDTEVGVLTAIASQVKQQPLRVWPNPSTGRFMLQLPEKGRGTMEIRLVNALGEVVHHESRAAYTGSRQELNFQNVAAGMYLLQVTQNGNTFASQVVIQK
jgi:hypothetical protein